MKLLIDTNVVLDILPTKELAVTEIPLVIF